MSSTRSGGSFIATRLSRRGSILNRSGSWAASWNTIPKLRATRVPDVILNVPLAELCPPPRALAGEPSLGTISCIARDGSLHHRQAEFVPLDAPSDDAATGNRSRRSPTGAVLVLLAAMDMTPAELSSTLSGDPTADELHRTIRQFRRTQAAAYAVESLLGRSAAMGKVRAQVAAAASSGANCLICGPRGSGRGHVARAIHYHANPDLASKLIPIDCALDE